MVSTNVVGTWKVMVVEGVDVVVVVVVVVVVLVVVVIVDGSSRPYETMQ